jgi:hypothetical protein
LDRLNTTTGETRRHVVDCAQCGSSSGPLWAGWHACRIDDPECDETPALAFFCPTCAQAEFGS